MKNDYGSIKHRNHASTDPNTAPTLLPVASTSRSQEIARLGVRRPSLQVVAVLGWGALIATAHVLGNQLVRNDPDIKLFAPPLFGHFGVEAGLELAAAVVVAVVVVVAGRRIVTRTSSTTLLVMAVGAAGLWALTIAAVPGIEAVAEPLRNPTDYLRAVPQMGDPGVFLGGFVDDIARYPVHVQGHPPGMVLLLWSLDAIALGGATPAALLVIGTGASSVAAVLVAMRELGGEHLARRAAPFIALSPLAIWIATSADGFFAGIGAWGICLAVLACRRSGLRSDVLATAAGLILGVTLFLTYGAALIVAISAVVVAFHRSARVAMLLGSTLAAVVGTFAIAGFWWLDGLFATIGRYELGVASSRPYSYFLMANLAALAVAIGPAAVAGLSRITWRREWLLPAAALGAVALSNLSGLTKGEVERIWLPFAVWIMPAASAASGDESKWLSAQASWTLLVQVTVRTPW